MHDASLPRYRSPFHPEKAAAPHARHRPIANGGRVRLLGETAPIVMERSRSPPGVGRVPSPSCGLDYADPSWQNLPLADPIAHHADPTRPSWWTVEADPLQSLCKSPESTAPRSPKASRRLTRAPTTDLHSNPTPSASPDSPGVGPTTTVVHHARMDARRSQRQPTMQGSPNECFG